jgi:alkaline phosphatase
MKISKLSLAFILMATFTVACKTSADAIVQVVDKVEEQNPQAKNIILLIGDGMGLSQITAGTYRMGNQSALENFKVIGLQKTHAGNKLITDSAASATAMATGTKTYNGAIGVDMDTLALQTILEEAEYKNLATGLIATSTIVHATPASFISHNKYRKNYEEIATDFLKTEIDFFVGGGKAYFDNREDEQNLLEQFSSDYQISHFVESDLSDIVVDQTKNFGFLTSNKDPLPVSQGRNYLKTAANLALDHLPKRSDKGFFLMIEGSQIDWGGHANDMEYIISEFIEFSDVIQTVFEFAQEDGETLVIVTADHETGGFAVQTGSEMDSLVSAFTSGSHTGTMVPVFAYGPGSELFGGIYDNTSIYHKMREAYGWSSLRKK